MNDSPSTLLGAHTSTAGGLHNALYEGESIAATTVQLFTSNQRQWKGRELDAEQLRRWGEAREATGIKVVMSHDSYLINLGAADEEVYKKSLQAFIQELQRCHSLEIDFLNFHPGAAVNAPKEECLERIANTLIELAPLTERGKTRLLLECTAGQGSTVGSRFEELAYIISRVEGKVPIGVCIDTCHAFAAGYDMRGRDSWDATLADFDAKVGFKHLYAMHLNDSVKGLGSRVDRHAPLGKGLIGLEAFRLAMTDPRTAPLPKYLETPDGPPLWKEEIALLKSFVLEE